MKKERSVSNINIKKIILIAGLIILLALSVFWYVSVLNPYVGLQFRMMKSNWYDRDNNFVHDDEGYTYAIAFPTYLYWYDGNLSVVSPLEVVEENIIEGKNAYAADSSLIIWLKHYSGDVREVGVRLDGREVYLENRNVARYADDQPYVDEYQEEIDRLLNKAESVWGIEIFIQD